MIQKKNDISYTLLGLLYPFITVLPIYFVIKPTILMFIIPFILLFLFIPLYRGYIKQHIYDFEDARSAIPSFIIIVSVLVTIILNLILIKSKPSALLATIPTAMILVFAYIFTLFDFINDNSDSAILKTRFNHILDVEVIIKGSIVFKLILVITLIFLNMFTLPFLWIIGFLLDIVIIINMRNKLYYLFVFQNGTFSIQDSPFRSIWAYIVLSISLIIALLTSRNFSLLPYTYIIKFLNWLSSFGRDYDAGDLPPVKPEVLDRGPGGIDLSQIETSEISPTLQALWKILEVIFVTILYGATIVLVFYFLFYPLLAPLFNKNREKISFKDYYKKILNGIINFMNNVKEVFLSFFIDHIKDDVFTPKKHVTILTQTQIKRDKKEVKAILKQYFKLTKWATKKKLINKSNNLSVDLFFNKIETVISKDVADGLTQFFNSGFYSLETITKNDFKEIKNRIRDVLKSK
ncbi:MAG: hypothetical protein OCD02_18170 [Spirochaetaceae bacterium]